MLERAGAELDQVSFHRWPTDRSWTRDSGPIFVRNAGGKVAMTNWRFNALGQVFQLAAGRPDSGRVAGAAWACPSGGRRSSWRAARRIGWCWKAARSTPTAQGILLTTEECLLSEVQQRNPGVGREQLERGFHDYLGIERVLWLGRGIAGDDTHGHVDDISRFVGPATIVTAVEPNTTTRTMSHWRRIWSG